MRVIFFALVAILALASAERMFMEPNVAATESLNWVQGARAPAEADLTLYFMMRHEAADVKYLEEVLLAVSDPTSPLYGNHLSRDELAALTPISDEKLAAVESFLAGSGATMELNHNKDIMKVTISVAHAERLFQTEINHFTHSFKGATLFRATKPYSVPAAVHSAVSVIGDLVYLPVLSEPLKVNLQGSGQWENACTGLSGCKGLVTPAVIRKAYSVTGDDGMDAVGNSMSIASFQGQYYKTSDLDKFGAGCGLNVTVDKTIGGNREQAGVETMLDIEYSKGVSPDIPLTVRYSNSYSLLNWVNDISASDSPSYVNSVSYGNDENQQTSDAFMFSCNTQFMKAGARGLTIMFASGDQGVCGREGCTRGLPGKRFKPDFPAGSPYITSVGGTNFLGAGIGAESAWSGSGGGFSDTFDIPSWQADIVAQFKVDAAADGQLPEQSLFNNTGRGYPDIAALGGQKTPYCVVANGRAEGVAGTSASSPASAAIFARLNGLRLKAGKPVLGFLNPFIYQNAAAFNDVAAGDNKCSCGYGDKEGFTARAGWDPVTGVGSPNFAKLAKIVLA